MPGLDLITPGWLMVGASGMVGRLVRHAWMREPDVAMRLVPQLRHADGEDEAGALFWAPLEGPEPFERYVREDGSPAALIMLAGVIPGPHAKYIRNVELAVACLEAARSVGCERVLIASSAAVYGPSFDIPLREDSVCAPIAPYGTSKLAMEKACRPYREMGMDVCCLRIGNVVGADAFMRNAASRSDGDPALSIDRFADGCGPVRSYIGPDSLARVLAALAAHPGPLPDVMNVAAPVPVDMADLARSANQDFEWRDAPDSALQHVTLDCARLAGFYDFEPEECTANGMVSQMMQSGLVL